MRFNSGKPEESNLVEIRWVSKNAVVRFESGALGYVLLQQPSKGQTFAHVEGQGTVSVALDTLVDVVAEPDDLAFAYVKRPAMRPMVQQALAQARLEAAQAMDALFDRKRH